MNNRHIIAVLLAMALTVPCAYAQEAEQQQQECATPVQAAETIAPLAQDPAMVTGTLENGLRYIIRPTKEPAGRACVRLFVNTGSLNETPEEQGISHFIEHMVFNGSRHFKRGELIPTMQKLGLGFGGDANAYTSFFQTVYMLDLPNLEEQTVDFAMTIMRDFADGATLDDDAIDHERGIIVSELKSRDSQNYRAQIAELHAITPGTRLADYMPIGTEEIIRNAPYERFRNYYHSHYVPGNMTVIVTGDVTPGQAEGWIRKHFADMEAREAEPRKPFEPLTDLGPCELVQANMEQGNITLNMAVVSPYEHKRDTIEQRVEDMPLALASGMLNRRLARISRKADSPFMAASVNKDNIMKASDVFTMGATARPERWKEALTRVEQEVRSATEHGFSEAELKEMLLDYENRLKQTCRSWETVTAQAMAKSIITAVGEDDILTAPEEDLRAFYVAVKPILEDPDLCRQALAKEYQAERTKLLALGIIDRTLTPESLREAFNEAHATPAPKQAEQEELSFAYNDPGQPGSVVEMGAIEDLGVTTLRLSNGVRVNLKPTDFDKGTISVIAAVDGGILNIPAKPALAPMITSVMENGGLEAHTSDELQRLLVGKMVGNGFNVSEDRFMFTGKTNADDFEFQCKLLAAAIQHPGFRKDGEELLHRQLPAYYQRLRSTPDGTLSMMSARLMFKNDPRFSIPEPQAMMEMTADEARAAIEPFLKDGAMEVTIVGDFKVEEVIPAILRSFGAMPERKAEFSPIPDEKREVNMAPWGVRQFFRYPTQLDKTIVTQIRPAGNGMDYKRNRRLQLLTAIAREKLFDGIRAAMGQAYSPIVRFTSNTEFKDAAFITTISHGVKGNRELVDSAMFSILSGMGEGAIEEEDFECAIRPMLTAVQKQMRTNGFWEGGISRIQSKPERVEQLRDILDDLRSITFEEIRELSKEVFGSGKVDHFFTVPADTEIPQGEEAVSSDGSDKEQAEPQPAAEDDPIAEEVVEEATPAEEPSAEAPAEETAPAPQAAAPAVSYTVLMSAATAAMPEWKQVADALVAKYSAKGWKVSVETLPGFSKSGMAEALRRNQARYCAAVLRPEEVSRPFVSAMHRAARMVDDDPWGDCMWGIVTGYTAQDALRIAQTDTPLVIKRLLGTTNVGAGPFEYSYCITDWQGFPVLEQSGYTAPKQTTYTADTPEGKEILEHGTQGLVADRMEHAGAQMFVTSSHATQYNLEMPFSMGLIFPCANRFHQLPRERFGDFARALGAALGHRDLSGMQALATQCKPIEPDGTTRVWLAAGNCLIGDANGDPNSMAITAISAYTCNQFVGYTVPSWFGESGWGTLSCFFDNTNGTSLAEAFFLNNQFLLLKTIKLEPRLLMVEFNEPQLDPRMMQQMANGGIMFRSRADAQQAMGLVHDRDVLALYGDPAWVATIDDSHAGRPYSIEWKDAKTFTITANYDREGRCAVWFPTAETGKDAKGCNVEGAIFTNDFVLFPELKMKKGETITVTVQ